MKLLLLLASLLLAQPALRADPNMVAASLTASGQVSSELSFLGGRPAGLLQVSGASWLGAICVQVSLDDVTWSTVPVYGVSGSYAAGAFTTSISSNGLYSVNLGGASYARVSATALYTGTCTVYLAANQGVALVQQCQVGLQALLVQTAPTPSVTPTFSNTSTATPTSTPTPTSTQTPTQTISPSATKTNTPTVTPNCTTTACPS